MHMHIYSNTVCGKFNNSNNMSDTFDPQIDYFSSARAGDIDVVKSLLQKYPGGYWNMQNKHGVSSMQIAAEYGQTEVLKAFVDHGGGYDLNVPTDNSYLETPANLAQTNHHDKTYEYIINQLEMLASGCW